MKRALILIAVSLAALGLGLAIGARLWPRSTSIVGAPPATPRTARVNPPAGAGATSTAVVTITAAEQLQRLLAEHPGQALLDFGAERCKPCKELEPRLAELSLKRPALLIASIDVDANETVANAYKAEDLPVLVHLDGGKEVARLVGAPTLAQLEQWLDQPPGK